MKEIRIRLTDKEHRELRDLVPEGIALNQAAGEYLRWCIGGGMDHLIDSLLESWVSLLSIRDLETMEHTRRVTEYTGRLAARMGFSGQELLHIRRGALLHDMGKLGIPDEVLWKNGVLNEDEQQKIKKHPDLAVQMLEPLEFLRPSLDIPHFHHERYDGSGYPMGLAGDAIPIAARLFAVVDVWDALSSPRSYSNHAWSSDEIKKHFQDEAGRMYDPEVVRKFLVLLEESKTPVQEEIHERR